jgi:putative ABC transport system permease protein
MPPKEHDMALLRTLLLKFIGIFRKARLEQQLDEDVRAHLEMLAEENLRRGMEPEEARYAALQQFGNVSSMKEECRERWKIRIIEELLQDVRYGLRQLRRNPGFTIVAVLTLALGIGGTAAIFSVVNAVILRPLPFRDPGRLVSLWATFPRWDFSGPGALTDPDFVEWQRQGQVFDQISAFHGQTSNLTGVGDPERLLGATVTANFFHLLGVSPGLGRTFLTSEEHPGSENRVVLSHKLWTDRFNSNPAVLGRSITLDGKPFTVIGVMPTQFQFPNQADFWTPLVLTSSRANATDQIVARLKSGVTIERAENDIRLIEHRLNPHAGPNAIRESLVYLHEELTSNIRPALLILLAAVSLVLLIACANVANLLLARAAVREREITIRKTLGGTPARIVRQVLTESLLLAGLGGIFGLILAVCGRGFLVLLLPQNLGQPGLTSRMISVTIDGWVLGFTALITLITGMLFGLAPALQASKREASPSLKDSSATHSVSLRLTGLRSLLTVGQVALTLVLLVSAGLLIKSLVRLLSVDPGFQPSHVITMNLELPAPKYSTSAQMRAFHRSALEGIESLPGVTTAGTVGSGIPFGEGGIAGDFKVEGHPALPQGVSASKLVISPGYFQTMRIPTLSGRYFSQSDTEASQHVAVVSEGFARRFWPEGKALGQRIDPGFSGTSWCTVVGVVGDVKQSGLASKAPLTIYLPYSQAPQPFLMNFMTIVVRTPLNPTEMANAVRRVIQSVDRDLPIYGIASMEDLISTSTSEPRVRSMLLGFFAALALVLATVGVYGVVSYSVVQRTHEIGIRMALGAQKSDVLGMVIGQGLRLALTGVAIGIVGTLALTRFLISMLYGVKPTDPVTFIAVALLLISVALVACYIPARRASKVDPMVALRYE